MAQSYTDCTEQKHSRKVTARAVAHIVDASKGVHLSLIDFTLLLDC